MTKGEESLGGNEISSESYLYRSEQKLPRHSTATFGGHECDQADLLEAEVGSAVLVLVLLLRGRVRSGGQGWVVLLDGRLEVTELLTPGKAAVGSGSPLKLSWGELGKKFHAIVCGDPQG